MPREIRSYNKLMFKGFFPERKSQREENLGHFLTVFCRPFQTEAPGGENSEERLIK